MPLLLYGLAIGELLFRWRDYFKKERRYWPHVITGLVLLDLVFANFYYMYGYMQILPANYIHFLIQLLHPIIFFLIVSVYTPEADSNVKQYFQDRMRLLFSLLALFIVSNVHLDYDINLFNAFRLFSIIICLLIAYTRKFWLIWFLITARLAIILLNHLYTQII